MGASLSAHQAGSAASVFRRMGRYSRPYLWLIGLALVCSLVFAGARYGRALLMKPLLDDVLMPYQAVSSETRDWLPDLGFGSSEITPPAPATNGDAHSKAV